MQIRVNETKEANITCRRNDRLFTKGDESVSSICMLVIMETLLDRRWDSIMLEGSDSGQVGIG